MVLLLVGLQIKLYQI